MASALQLSKTPTVPNLNIQIYPGGLYLTPSKNYENTEHLEAFNKIQRYFETYSKKFYKFNEELGGTIESISKREVNVRLLDSQDCFNVRAELSEFIIQLMKSRDNLKPPQRIESEWKQIKMNPAFALEVRRLNTTQEARATESQKFVEEARNLLDRIRCRIQIVDKYRDVVIMQQSSSPSSSSSMCFSSSGSSTSSSSSTSLGVSPSSSSSSSSSDSSMSFSSSGSSASSSSSTSLGVSPSSSSSSSSSDSSRSFSSSGSSTSSSSSTSLGVSSSFSSGLSTEVSDEDRTRLEPYLKFLAAHSILQRTDKASEGGIEIVTDIPTILQIERQKNQKTGILAKTAFQTYLCDPVKFPDGSFGAYGRIFWNQALQGTSGAVVLPILPNGKILCVVQYAYPAGGWEVRLPRGNAEPGEQINGIVKRELREETGAEFAGPPVIMGSVYPDSGLTFPAIPLAKVEITKWGKTERDPAEVSMRLLTVTLEELEQMFLRGSHKMQIEGQMRDVRVQDGFTMAALYLNYLSDKYKKKS